MGTLVWRPEILKAAARNCAALKVHCVVSLGGKSNGSNLKHVAERTTVLTTAPHRAILVGCSVFVTYGGMNLVVESLLAGKLMVVIPVALDQFAIAERVRESGLGRVVAWRNATEETLRAAVAAVLADVAMHRQCKEFAQDLRARGPGARIAMEAIERKFGSWR